jgi:hypothetical protein
VEKIIIKRNLGSEKVGNHYLEAPHELEATVWIAHLSLPPDGILYSYS